MSNLQPSFTTHGRDLRDSYERIRNGDENITWALYTYEKNSNDLKVLETGQGGILEFVDNFSDGKIMYAFARVIDPNSGLSKFVLIGWCGEGVPEDRKWIFNTHFPAVQKFLQGYHVSISARTQADVEPDVIMKKVEDASGAKYGVGALVGIFEGIQTAKQEPPVFRSSRVPDPVLKPSLKPTPVRKPTPSAFGTIPPLPKPLKGPSIKMGHPKEIINSPSENIASPNIAAIKASYTTQNNKHTPSSEMKKDPISSFVPRSSHSFGTAPPLPGTLKRESKAIPGFQARGLQGEKTPSQIWAESKAKKGMSIEKDVLSPPEDEPVDVAAIRERFSQTSVSPVLAKDLHSQSIRTRVPGSQVLASLDAVQSQVSTHNDTEESTTVESPPCNPPRFLPTEIHPSELKPPLLPMNTKPGTASEVVEVNDDTTEQEGVPQPPLSQGSKDNLNDDNLEEHQTTLTENITATVVYDYTQAEANEINLVVGDVINWIDKVDEGWWVGTNMYGDRGLFPKDYVEEIKPTNTSGGRRAEALYEYTAVEDNEISFEEGDIISQIDFPDANWWCGEIRGTIGLFPANYVKLIPE